MGDVASMGKFSLIDRLIVEIFKMCVLALITLVSVRNSQCNLHKFNALVQVYLGVDTLSIIVFGNIAMKLRSKFGCSRRVRFT